MTHDELVKVVARIQAGDNRVVDSVTMAHWKETIGHLAYGDAYEAVVSHFRTAADYLTAAHIVTNARAIAKDRAMRSGEVESGKIRAPRPANDVALHAAHKSGDPARIAHERAVYNRQCVDAGLAPIPEWGLV